MSERHQVNIRLDRVLLAEIDRLAADDAIDRSEMARRLLDSGLATRRMRRALDEYRSGNVTAWRAARIAGVSLYEMLDRIHEEGIPYELDPQTLDRVEAAIGGPRAVHERPAGYGGSVDRPESPGTPGSAASDAETGIVELREQFRPDKVAFLFVGESSPAGGTHFYRANSNLFRAVREAFAQAFGEDAIPDGPRFLREFQERGAWLVDLVDRPVDRLPDSEREAVVDAGVDVLADTIGLVRPARIVVVKATIKAPARRAIEAAGSDADLLALPFPVRQWRAVFIRELAEALRRWSAGS